MKLSNDGQAPTVETSQDYVRSMLSHGFNAFEGLSSFALPKSACWPAVRSRLLHISVVVTQLGGASPVSERDNSDGVAVS